MIDALEKEIEGIGEAFETDITDIRSPRPLRELRDRYLGRKKGSKKPGESA
jgi:hypothetical protein